MKKWKKQDPEEMAVQNIVTDPFGMYTGIPVDPDERPIQDADDL